ncbi:hypothetical protein FQN53_009807 [Emmonsiellopsis sp. PD_33]|nr:hypothetical protein FQN53_009807 [Emmonsiellopsis sp. PD_33]
MALPSRLAFVFYVLAVLHIVLPAAAITLDYCSSLNTGSDFDAVRSTYQSNGACRDTCVGKYAFAILQGKSCWCSNLQPGDTTSTDECSDRCPGFPSDRCGNAKKGLYGYLILDRKASGTVGQATKTSLSVSITTFLGPWESFATIISSNSPTLSASSLSQTPSYDVAPKPTAELDPNSSVLTSSVQSTFLSRASTTSSTDSQSEMVSTLTSHITTAPTGTSTISLGTVSGHIVTLTVGPGSSQTGPANASGGSAPLSGGAIAGIIIGALLAFGLALAAVLWVFCMRRRRDKEMSDDSPTSPYDRPVPSPSFHGTIQSPTMSYTPSRPMNNAYGSNGAPSQTGNRLSVPAFTDSRMKKDAAIYPNGGRHSNVSLQDNQDYSRPVLRLTNPDP